MKVGLFIPCYINQFYPQVGIATLEILEGCGLDVGYPRNQTCCGQPLANSGYEHSVHEVCQLFVENFKDFDVIVAPSGSCVYYVKHHYNKIAQTPETLHVRNNTYELSYFLNKVIKKKDFKVSFPYKVALHQSCHGLRGLNLGSPSELMTEPSSVVKELLEQVSGLELVELEREDECCGFGGTFAVKEAAVSVKMAKDRLSDHLRNKAQVVTATDMSCLMHLQGVAKKQNLPLRIMHIAEILNYKGD
jgi:L-lactate dehydrogenase complex protein LldE